MTRVDVLVVGAGPTGLALACDLGRRGVSYRIVDKAPAYFNGSRGKGLQPRSLEVLDDLGVVDRMIANGRFHLPFRAYDGDKELGTQDPHAERRPTNEIPYESVMLIPQWRVEEILRARLEALGGRVELGQELVALAQDDEAVTATLGTETVRVPYLVAVDGGRSFVRKALGVGFEGETRPEERMLVGDVKVDGLDRDHWHAWPKAADGFLTLCPLPSTDSFQLQAQLRTDDDVEPSLALFQELVDRRTGRSDLRLREAGWLSLYRTNVRMVDRYRVGRVFLAGDAAHVHSPAGGQGMNTGIQDGYNLGWKLGQVLGGAAPALLDTYEEERLPIAAAMLDMTSRLHRQVFVDTTNLRRDGLTLQLGINYRGSSLCAEADPPATTPLRAGDRAPDGRLPDGTRLFDLFRGPHFTLLALGDVDATAVEAVAARHARFVRGHRLPLDPVRTGYGDAPALFVVRPDGYLGFVGRPGATAEADRYLAGFG